ncbi:DUF6044 family protein [Exiguobacterium antarcticum]|uniref:DUF6044 family protein n=1 Tax=Exiguobacterium antarcticum TaxID=132920 RepID=A0ABT6R4B0_9BACL|nr:DUF6044 family protein [Exiguobacterium antarcticum]MDI3235791.1 DUF6044 family protein [Exiguobacterium antarcticum]
MKTKELIRIGMGVLLTLGYLLPLFWFGEQAHIRIHDNLDSNIVWYKNLVDSDRVYAGLHDTVPNLVGGVVSRNAFVSEWTGIIWLYQWFSPFTAYVVSQTLTRLFAFLGLYLLLRDHLKLQLPRPGILLVAVLFAWTPVWPSGMLSTLGMPLLLWAYLNLWYNKRIVWSSVTLLLVPFYSSFVLGIVFFLALLAVVSFVIEWRQKSFHRWFWFAFGGQVVLYLIIEYRLVYSMLWQDEVTSRDQFELGNNGVWRTIRLFFKQFVLGHTHAEAAQSPVLLLLVLTVITIAVVQKDPSVRLMKHTLFLLMGLSLWYACWFYSGWNPLKQRIHVMQTFNFARFHFMEPMLWYILFALALDWLWRRTRKRLVIGVLFLQAVVLIIWNPEIVYRNQPSFSEFYAVDQFSTIRTYIGKPRDTYNVVSLGLHPAVAQYNGFQTLDGYVNFYPIDYKREFRNIIAGELKKSPRLTRYFDNWGNRVYVYAAELGKHYDYTKTNQKPVRQLDIDTVQLKRMGGDYLLSAVPIQNARVLGLQYEKTFRDDQSAWLIYLYRVAP